MNNPPAIMATPNSIPIVAPAIRPALFPPSPLPLPLPLPFPFPLPLEVVPLVVSKSKSGITSVFPVPPELVLLELVALFVFALLLLQSEALCAIRIWFAEVEIWLLFGFGSKVSAVMTRVAFILKQVPLALPKFCEMLKLAIRAAGTNPPVLSLGKDDTRQEIVIEVLVVTACGQTIICAPVPSKIAEPETVAIPKGRTGDKVKTNRALIAAFGPWLKNAAAN